MPSRSGWGVTCGEWNDLTLGPHWHSNTARSSTTCEFSFTRLALWHLWSTEWMCWAFCFPVDWGTESNEERSPCGSSVWGSMGWEWRRKGG